MPVSVNFVRIFRIEELSLDSFNSFTAFMKEGTKKSFNYNFFYHISYLIPFVEMWMFWYIKFLNKIFSFLVHFLHYFIAIRVRKQRKWMIFILCFFCLLFHLKFAKE